MTQEMTSSSICRSVTYILRSSDFVPYLEDCLWRNLVLGIMDQCDTKIDLVKYMWVSDLYFKGHCLCLFNIVIDLNYLYTLRNGTGRGYSCPSGHLL